MSVHAEDFMLLHLARVENPCWLDGNLSVIIDNGNYSVIFISESDKKWKTGINSSEYNILAVEGEFIAFSGKDKHIIWNRKILLESDYTTNLRSHSLNSVLVYSMFSDNIWFVNTNMTPHIVQTSSLPNRNLLMFSDFVFMCYNFSEKDITFYFYSYDSQLIKTIIYKANFSIFSVTYTKSDRGSLFTLLDYKNDPIRISILPDYTVREFANNPEGDFEIDISDNNAIIKKYTGTTITLQNISFIKIYENNVLSTYTEHVAGRSYNIYKIQLYDIYFTTIDRFNKLSPSKKQTIYTLMLIYKYSRSQLGTIPFEILLCLFGMAV